jgi:hypothetical protein
MELAFFDHRLSLLANLSLTQSLFPFLSYMFSWNSVSWSISTEMCFYLCFPVLLAGLTRFWPLYLLISMLLVIGTFGSLSLSGVPLASDDVYKVTISVATYANPLVRGFEFCLGMASWVLWDRYLRGVKAHCLDGSRDRGAGGRFAMAGHPVRTRRSQVSVDLAITVDRHLRLMLGIRGADCRLRQRAWRDRTVSFDGAPGLAGRDQLRHLHGTSNPV